MRENRFILFSAGYNCSEWIERHIKSVQKQTYKNYIHVIIDDATDDGTWKEIAKWKGAQVVVHRNKCNRGWVYNATKYIERYIQNPEDIIVGFDLDDWFAHEDVLARLNQIYNEKKCWVTYGGFVRSNGRMEEGNFSGYPSDVIKNRTFKKYRWRFWAMRTFKAFLWNAIDKNDLKGPEGEYPKTTYDYAIGFPLLELCPPERLYYIGNKEVLYIYNYRNPLNDKKINKVEQVRIGHWYSTKPVCPVYIPKEKEEKKVGKEAIRKIRVIKLPDKMTEETKRSEKKKEGNRFIVFSAGTNCKHFVKRHMESVFTQRYNNFVHVVVDDCSIDNTISKVQRYGHDKMVVHRNTENVKWLENAVRYLPKHIKSPQDIILVLDLDDWFAHDKVLQRINYMYELTDCWLSYGQYQWYFDPDACIRYAMESKATIARLGLDYDMIITNIKSKGKNKDKIDKKIKPATAILSEIVETKTYRAKNVADASHPKTFRAFLWDSIDKNDFKGPYGTYAHYCYDRALMYPMLEMCPADRIRFMNEVLYIYNSSNPLCVGWTNRKEQILHEDWFREKEVYKELKE